MATTKKPRSFQYADEYITGRILRARGRIADLLKKSDMQVSVDCELSGMLCDIDLYLKGKRGADGR